MTEWPFLMGSTWRQLLMQTKYSLQENKVFGECWWQVRGGTGGLITESVPLLLNWADAPRGGTARVPKLDNTRPQAATQAPTKHLDDPWHLCLLSHSNTFWLRVQKLWGNGDSLMNATITQMAKTCWIKHYTWTCFDKASQSCRCAISNVLRYFLWAL